jgi:hypothetical protein
MEPIMLLNRIAMFLLLIMVFLTGFPHCLRLDTPSFLSLINHILSDSGNTFTPAIAVLDTSFNSPNGFIIQPIGSDDQGYSLAINPMEKSYSVVIAIMEAIMISASLVLILMALSILLLVLAVK